MTEVDGWMGLGVRAFGIVAKNRIDIRDFRA